MTKGSRALATAAALALVLGACTRGLAPSGSTNAQPQDIYAAIPSLAGVRALLGDDNWWPGPPSFGVRPLGVDSMPASEKFSVAQSYVHVGSAETFGIDIEVWNDASAAKSHMSSVLNALGSSAITTGPKVGDQAIYYGSQGSGAAPYQTASIVRVGQVVAVIQLALKDGFPKLAQLGKNASAVVSRLRDVISGKLRGGALSASDASVLPAPNLDISQLGAARISVEAATVMLNAPSIDLLAQTLRGEGVNDVIFGDYALNDDTRMEVRATLFNFLTAQDANDWLTLFRGSNSVDQQGIAAFYEPTHGEYMLLFASGTKGALLICRSTAPSEAASRACEAPLSRVIAAWKLSLG